MSELHTYRLLHVDLRTGLHTGRALERAFSAADAVTQFRAKNPAESVGPVFEIEPLPDAPTPQQAEADTPRREWTTIPVGEKSPKPEIGTARAATPDDRIEALEAALRERTAERDRAWADRDALIDGIMGGGTAVSLLARGVPGVVDLARGHRDQIDEARKLARARLDALNEIAAVVWPNGEDASHGYAHDDLVEAVRKTGVERANIRSEHDRLRRERNTLQVMLDRERARSEEAARDHDSERDALQKRIDGIAETLGDTTTDAVQRVSRALFLLRGHDTHSLQKRIDAAKAWISDRSWNAARGASFDALLAILEDRAPESAEPASSKSGRWRCKRCGAEVTVTKPIDPAQTVADKIENDLGKWEWIASASGGGRWAHWCRWGCGTPIVSWCERIEVGAP